MSERALELLHLPDNQPCFLLDIGCGSGLSGEILDESGHHWVGLDISPAMLDVALERGCEGDLFLQDAGQGVGFRPGSFDGAISISCIQWLCNSDASSHNPRRRLMRFFTSLYTALRHGARAVFQFYPENAQQIELITSSAMQSGFTGGLVVDYPNSTKRKKYFLCLFVGTGTHQVQLPQGLTDEGMVDAAMDARSIQVNQNRRDRTRQHKSKRSNPKDRDWVLRKKESRRHKGFEVGPDTKYTARKRRPKF